MKFAKNKTVIAIAIFLMLSMAASMMLVPTANAHDPPWQIPTYAYIFAAPNPIGVGQYTYIYMWLDKMPDGAAMVNDVRFHNYKLTITDPDGDIETKTWDVVWDTTSSQGYAYTPDKVGTYTLKFEFPGQVYTWSGPIAGSFTPGPTAYTNDTYLPSSASTTLTVQEEPISDLPDSYPLPTEYWTRPIYGENPGWWSISSNWLGTGAPSYSSRDCYPGDAIGPQTGHVMWTKPLQSGGVVGGNTTTAVAGATYFDGSAYLFRFTNPIILNGKLYYTEPLSFKGAFGGMGGAGNYQYGPTDCVDLRTGELIWSRTDVHGLSFGYVYDVQNPNQHGVCPPMLVAQIGGGMQPPGVPVLPPVWEFFDADTGNWLFNVTNVPSGTTVLGPQGEHLKYVMANAGSTTNPDWRLLEWNSSNVFFVAGSPPVSGSTVNASLSSSYNWNISIPWRNTMSSVTVVAAYYNNMMICYNGSLPSITSQTPYTYFAVNLNPEKGAIGSVLWWNTVNPPPGNVTVLVSGADPTVGVFTESYKETMQFVGYSMATGQKIWGPTASQTALDYYGTPYSPSFYGVAAYGKLYSSAYGGIMYCYNLTSGSLLWTYGNGGEGNSTNSGFQVPGPYPTFIYAIANGIVYTITTEHTIQTPIYKGALTRAINATDGTEIWTLSAYTHTSSGAAAIADGYATFFNGYDNQIYCVGKGPSATTVTAGPEVSVEGSSVLVKGTVIDTAAGTDQNEQAARFPDGVPAVSDANMTAWMGYVYQQKPLPTDVVGVEVVVSVLDPNNNCYEVGRTTSDASGFFKLSFVPEVPGEYTIIAAFEGSNGYWHSQAKTAINVEEAPAATPGPTPSPAPMTDTYVLGLGIASIVAIVVIGLIIILMFRKR